MADNIAITAGAGTSVGTKDLAGVHLQKVIWVTDTGALVAKVEDVAHASGDPGVMVFAVRNDAGTVLAGTSGDYIPLATDSSGRLMVADASVPAVTLSSGSVNVTSHVASNISIHTSAARTATPTAVEQTNDYARGVIVHLHVTVSPATPLLTPTISYKDDLSGVFQTVLAATQITSTDLGALPAHFTYCVYPTDVTAATFTKTANVPLSRTWKTTITHGDADSVTYSVSGNYLL